MNICFTQDLFFEMILFYTIVHVCSLSELYVNGKHFDKQCFERKQTFKVFRQPCAWFHMFDTNDEISKPIIFQQVEIESSKKHSGYSRKIIRFAVSSKYSSQ